MAKSKSTTRSRGLSPIVLDRMLQDLQSRLADEVSLAAALAKTTAMMPTMDPWLRLVQSVARSHSADLRGLADLVELIIERTATPAVIKERLAGTR